jgi:hypothetical protein
MLTLENIQARLNSVNQTIPVHSMLDGFWIFDFERGRLTVSCSFDRTSYRNFDIEFKEVIFFNIPAEWADDNVRGDILFRLADKEEFALQQPYFNVGDNYIIALDLTYAPRDRPVVKHTFYIVASDLYAEKCLTGNANPSVYYKDKLKDEPFPCMKNRVV